MIRRALAIDEQSYGADHPDVAKDLNKLATFLCATSRLAEATPLMRRTVEIFLRSARHRLAHPHLRAAIAIYAGLLQAMGRTPQQALAEINALASLCGIRFGGA